MGTLWFSLMYLAILFLVCFSLNILANSVSSLQPSCPEHEKSALLQFKHSFQINCSVSPDRYEPYTPYPKVHSWIGGVNSDCCSWDGVGCNKKTGHVISLNLSGSCLYGSFPTNSSLSSLNHLESLVLDFNHFNYSQIPSSLCQFCNLRALSLWSSGFKGLIPAEISKLSNLKLLFLGDSVVHYPSNLKIKESTWKNLIHNLTRLQVLNFENVDISSPFPFGLINLTSLSHMILRFCNLYAEVPPNLFHMPHLEILNLDGNNYLAGYLPQFDGPSPLQVISLFKTAFAGALPPSIGRLTHLEVLDLGRCGFSGTIPSSLGNLTNLTFLKLGGNYFTSDMAFISNLTKLQMLIVPDLTVIPVHLVLQLPKLHELKVLVIDGVNIGTKIPSLANLTKLEHLVLSDTGSVGPLPEWIPNLTQIVELSLGGNKLEGQIPQWFRQLNSLEVLNLSYTNLFGEFNTFSPLGNLRALSLSGVNLTFRSNFESNSSLLKLELLELDDCNLTEFPQLLRDQNDLELLSLKGNNIKGSIPQWFVKVTRDSLLSLDLSNNNLIGFQQPAPSWNCLEALDLSGNNLQGPLPLPSPFLKDFDASSNHLTGLIPKQICNIRSLVSLHLSSNNVSGPIPDCLIHELGESLQLLDLRGNKLQGIIPSALTKACSLKMINLSENLLKGELPRSLINCTMLEVLDMGKNIINDTFPAWLGSLPKLQVLVLRHNRFHGSIPDSKSSIGFRVLRIIDLSYNLHSGHLPSGYIQNWPAMSIQKEDQPDSLYIDFNLNLLIPGGYKTAENKFQYSITIVNKGNERLYPKVLKVLRVMDFSSNNFTGKISEVIGNLRGLQSLNLSNNHLEGGIPTSVASMKDLESLDLSRNMLSGPIPSELSQLTSLALLDVSYNHLVGSIPQGKQFDTFDNSSYEGNPGLCGSPLSHKCGNTNVPPPPAIASDEDNEDSELVDWIIRSFGCLSGFIIGSIIGKFYITDRYHEWFMEMFQRRPRRRVRRSPRQMR